MRYILIGGIVLAWAGFGIFAMQADAANQAAGNVWSPAGVALVVTAIGGMFGTVLGGFAQLISARNQKATKEAAERAAAQSVENGKQAADIGAKVDGGTERLHAIIQELRDDNKRLHDEFAVVSRERVQDVKEATATAAAVAAAAAVLPTDGKPIPVQVVGTLDRRKDESAK